MEMPILRFACREWLRHCHHKPSDFFVLTTKFYTLEARDYLNSSVILTIEAMPVFCCASRQTTARQVELYIQEGYNPLLGPDDQIW